MGEAASHGITMGYVSDPFRTEEPANPDTEGVALSAHGVTMGRWGYRGANGCGRLPWFHLGPSERSLQNRKQNPDPVALLLLLHHFDRFPVVHEAFEGVLARFPDDE